jgi:transcriptional regulator with XRE-family HTH domain
MTFAEKLRELRDAKGLSEAKLAKLSGLPFGTVHTYGLGKRKPSLENAVKLAKALDVDCRVFAECDDIATGDGQEDEKPAAAKKPAAKKGKK